jgi:ribonuclease HII
VPAFLIDSLGIVRATQLAMEIAVFQLPRLPDALLIDALSLPGLPFAQQPIIGADHLSYSVAAASIIAKTTRDRLMRGLERGEERYGFAVHKGYGTTLHRSALARWGPCDEHRRSFRPLWNEEYDDNRS